MRLLCCSNGSIEGAIWRAGLNVADMIPSRCYPQGFSPGTLITTNRLYSPVTISGNGQTAGGLVVGLDIAVSNPVGSFTYVLRNTTTNTDAAVATAQYAHLPDRFYGLVFLPFSSNAVLTSGHSFKVGVYASHNNQARVIGYPLSYFLVGVDSLTPPAAGDSLFIVPHLVNGNFSTFQVTMDRNSDTVLGGLKIGHGCSLSFVTTQNTKLLCSGCAEVIGGDLLIGTENDPVPAAYTATLRVAGSVHVISSSNDSVGGRFIAYGTALYNTTRALLASTAAAGATTLTLDRSVNWRSGDTIVVAATHEVNQSETVSLTANANGPTISVTPLTYPHLGETASGLQAEVFVLRRNVTIECVYDSSCSVGWVGNGSLCQYVHAHLKGTTSVYYELQDISSVNSTLIMRYCLLTYVAGIYCNVDGPSAERTAILFEYCDCFNTNRLFTSSFSSAFIYPTNVVLNHNWVVSGQLRCELGCYAFTFTNNRFADDVSSLTLDLNSMYDSDSENPMIVSNNVVHTTYGVGLRLSVLNKRPLQTITIGTTPSVTCWHCCLGSNNAGVVCEYNRDVRFNGLRVFGSKHANVMINNNERLYLQDLRAGSTLYVPTSWGVTCDLYDGQNYGLWYFYARRVVLENPVLGATTAVSRPHTQGDVRWTPFTFGDLTLVNPQAHSPTFLTGTIPERTQIKVITTSGGQAYGSIWDAYGHMRRDTDITYNERPTVRLTPSHATRWLTLYQKRLGVLAQRSYRLTLPVRLSGNFNGHAELVALLHPRFTPSEVSLLNIPTNQKGTWLLLTADVPELEADSVVTLLVRCRGTAGYLNVSDFEVQALD